MSRGALLSGIAGRAVVGLQELRLREPIKGAIADAGQIIRVETDGVRTRVYIDDKKVAERNGYWGVEAKPGGGLYWLEQ